MTLQDWSNLAQVIGALAVVISLFYVGFQIKRNTSAVRSATAQAVHDNYADWYMTLARDAELNQIAIKGLKDYSSLDEIEKARFIETFMAFTALGSVSNATERICGSELFRLTGLCCSCAEDSSNMVSLRYRYCTKAD